MKTTFDSKSYPGLIARPRVELKYFENEKIYSVGVPWGSKIALTHLNQTISDNYLTLKDDDATTIGSQIQSTQGHILKSVLTQAGVEIYQKFNKDFYSTACEALILNFNDYHLSWIQIGQPYMLLLRDGQIQILQAARDLATDYSMQAPLPGQLLGISKDINLNHQDVLTLKDDVIILFNGIKLPTSLFTARPNKTDNPLQFIFDNAVKENKNDAFWLGCLFID